MTVYKYIGDRLRHTMGRDKWKEVRTVPPSVCPLKPLGQADTLYVIKSHAVQGEDHGHWVYRSELLDVTKHIQAGTASADTAAPQIMILTEDAKERKGMPITTGVLDYFPLAIAEVAKCSKAGNDQHNPGQPLHWAKDKSTDHADCIPRHLIDRGAFDTDGIRHSAKLAWRALALLQIELEKAKQ